MTHTIDHDCPAQSQHSNGHDVQYKESDDPAEQSSSEVDLLTFVTVLLLAKRSFETASCQCWKSWLKTPPFNKSQGRRIISPST